MFQINYELTHIFNHNIYYKRFDQSGLLFPPKKQHAPSLYPQYKQNLSCHMKAVIPITVKYTEDSLHPPQILNYNKNAKNNKILNL